MVSSDKRSEHRKFGKVHTIHCAYNLLMSLTPMASMRGESGNDCTKAYTNLL